MIKVSVVTTVYNGEAFLDRAIPSIINQDYDSFEWIIINDGSTDSTAKILEDLAFKDRRVKIIQSERLGFAKALNVAIEKSSGQYIARQDFDDVSFPSRLREQANFLDENPDVGLIGSFYILEDHNRKERYVRQVPTYHDGITLAMSKYIPFAHTIVMFRRSAWQQVGGYPEVGNAVDLRMWIKISSAGWKLSNLKSILGVHYVYGNSFWHKNFKYNQRQRDLAKVQLSAVRTLKLPLYMMIFPVSRYIYCYLPNPLKRLARRYVGGSNESDIRP